MENVMDKFIISVHYDSENGYDFTNYAFIQNSSLFGSSNEMNLASC